jgi:hypothetical protein
LSTKIREEKKCESVVNGKRYKKEKIGLAEWAVSKDIFGFWYASMVKPTWPEKTVLVCAIQCIISVPSIIIITPDITSNLVDS